MEKTIHLGSDHVIEQPKFLALRLQKHRSGTRKTFRDQSARRQYFDVECNHRQRGDLYITAILDEEMKPDTNLKMLRTLSGMSQAELAGRSGVSKRTIQQYEQRQKEINKAQSETLLKLSRAVNCEMEELLEKIPPALFYVGSWFCQIKNGI